MIEIVISIAKNRIKEMPGIMKKVVMVNASNVAITTRKMFSICLPVTCMSVFSCLLYSINLIN